MLYPALSSHRYLMLHPPAPSPRPTPFPPSLEVQVTTKQKQSIFDFKITLHGPSIILLKKGRP